MLYRRLLLRRWGGLSFLHFILHNLQLDYISQWIYRIFLLRNAPVSRQNSSLDNDPLIGLNRHVNPVHWSEEEKQMHMDSKKGKTGESKHPLSDRKQQHFLGNVLFEEHHCKTL